MEPRADMPTFATSNGVRRFVFAGHVVEAGPVV